MKMIMAIVQPKDSNRVRDALAKNKIGVTKLATSGGFLHEGNTTFMIVVDDNRVDEALEIIKANAKTRQEYMTPTAYITMLPILYQLTFKLVVQRYLFYRLIKCCTFRCTSERSTTWECNH